MIPRRRRRAQNLSHAGRAATEPLGHGGAGPVRRRRPRGRGCRPGPGHPAGRLPGRAVPHAGRRAAGLVVTRPTRRPAPGRPAGVPVAAPLLPAVLGKRGHRLRRRPRGVCRTPGRRRVDHPGNPGRLPAAPPAGVGAQRGVPRRRRRAGGRPVRRGHRRAVRRRVDVPPCARRLQGRPGGPGRPAARGGRRAARRAVVDTAPGQPGGRGGQPAGLPAAADRCLGAPG
jgi:hypothetical protein